MASFHLLLPLLLLVQWTTPQIQLAPTQVPVLCPTADLTPVQSTSTSDDETPILAEGVDGEEILGIKFTKRVIVPTLKHLAVGIIVPTATEVIVPTATEVIVPTATEVIVPTATEVIVPTATNVIAPTATDVIAPTATRVIWPTIRGVFVPEPTPKAVPTTTKPVQRRSGGTIRQCLRRAYRRRRCHCWQGIRCVRRLRRACRRTANSRQRSFYDLNRKARRYFKRRCGRKRLGPRGRNMMN